MKPFGMLFVGAGVILLLIGIVWASIVGYYPSEVPGLLASLGGGALLVFIGSRMVASTKSTQVEWRPTAPPTTPAAPVAPVSPPAAAEAPAPTPSGAQTSSETEHIDDGTIAVPRRRRRVHWSLQLPGGETAIVRNHAVVGRAPQLSEEHPDADLIVIDEASVSKSHALLRLTDGALYVLDLESANGTVVITDTLERSCIAGEWMLVPDGAILGLGTVDLQCSAVATREVAS